MTEEEMNNYDEFEAKYFEKMSKTSGHKKALNYFREIIAKLSFQNFVVEMRQKYDIPEEGFTDETGVNLSPSEKWKHYSDKDKLVELRREIHKIIKNYHLGYSEGENIIEAYIFYNVADYFPSPISLNLCSVSDLVAEKLDSYLQLDDNFLFPIAVRISPYASMRDILEYIEKTYKVQIEPLQKKYKSEKVKIGAFKKKKYTDRDNFIYQNRNFDKKELVALVVKNFGEVLDYAYITKIISNEKRRRKV